MLQWITDNVPSILSVLLYLVQYVCMMLVTFYILFRTNLFYSSDVLKSKKFDIRSLIRTCLLIIIFGLLAIYATVSGKPVFGGIANIRDLVVLAAGMLGGMASGIGAGVIGGLFRFIYGYINEGASVSALPCAIMTVVSGVAGGVFYKLNRGKFITPIKGFLFALVLESVHMGMVLLLGRPFDEALQMVKVISFPMIAANSLGMVIFSFMLQNFRKQQEVIATHEKVESEVKLVHSLQTNILPTMSSEVDGSVQKTSSFDWLIQYMKLKVFKANDVLFNKEDKADKLYFIKSGVLRLAEINKTATTGEIIGETGIFSPFHKRTISAVCETDMEIYCINQVDIIELLYKFPTLLFDLIQLSIKRFAVNLKNSITDKERIESELKIAHSIQLSMLPTIFPDRSEFDICAFMEPAKEVGGDFYDFFFIDDNKFCFIIGDVSGKGIPAALFMVISKTLLKTEACNNKPPAEILRRVNEMLCPDNEECMFVTVFCAILDIKTGELAFANAGHNPPLFYKKKTGFDFIEMHTGFVLAGMPGTKFKTQVLQMDPGDIFFLYTDGITEAMDPDDKQYSNEKLQMELTTHKSDGVSDMIGAVRSSVKTHEQGTEQSDDITMLVVKYNG